MIARRALQIEKIASELRSLLAVYNPFEKTDQDRGKLITLRCFHCAHSEKITRGRRTRFSALSPLDGMTSVSVMDSSTAAPSSPAIVR